MTAAEFATWCRTQAAAFRKAEPALNTSLHNDRDAALVEHVVNALANPYVDGCHNVIETIDRQRARSVAA